MKRINNLFEQIISLDNLRLADEKARKGKLRSYGVRKHDRNRDNNIISLHEKLKSGIYKTSNYHVFKMITDKGKEREIYQLPYFPDRIVHHAIMNIMEPVWMKVFTSNTYSCIKGRGIHGVVRKLKNDLKDYSNTRYCLKMDIRKFYPSIDHEILKKILRKKIKDKRLLKLLDEIIESAPGVPIGNYLSQFFANLFLSYFDHWLKEIKHVKYYYRYADDMVILSNNKKELHSLRSEIQQYLSKLKLTLKGDYQVFPVDSRGIDFVGYVFRHSHILLRKSIKKSFVRKAIKLQKQNLSEKEYNMQLSAYTGWTKHCNSINLQNKLSYEKGRIRQKAA